MIALCTLSKDVTMQEMDLLPEWFEASDELQRSLFSQEQVAPLVHSDESSGTSRGLPLLTSVSATPSTEPTPSATLLRSQSLDDIHNLTTTQSQQFPLCQELPSLPRSESNNRCQSVFPALNCSTADTSHVEIAFEMPRYLLQEDEALADEATTVEETTNPALSQDVLATDGNIVPSKASSPAVSAPSIPGKAPALMLPPLHSLHTETSLQATDTSTVNEESNVQSKNSSSHDKRQLQLHKTLPTSDASHSIDSGQMKNIQLASYVIGPTPSAQLAVCIPLFNAPKTHTVLNSGQILSLNAPPITVPQTTTNHFCEKKKRRHGGGWPKGKSRKTEGQATQPKPRKIRKVEGQLNPPKPPPTGYALFASEKRNLVQEQHGTNSTSVASKILGQMWSQLSPQAKEVYYSQAEKCRGEYFCEMRSYFAQCYKGASLDRLKQVDHLLDASIAAEKDDQILFCKVCRLSFTSLNNKYSHFSGRLHLQAIIEHLHETLGESNIAADSHSQAVAKEQESVADKNRDLSEQLSQVGMHHKAILTELRETKRHYSSLLEANVNVQQQLNEMEFIEISEYKVLNSLSTQGTTAQVALDSLTKIVTDLSKCRATVESCAGTPSS